MPGTFLTAGLACGYTRLQYRFGEDGVVTCLARQCSARRCADVSAIEACAYAFGEVIDIVFAKTRVGAGGAGLVALGACVDRCG